MTDKVGFESTAKTQTKENIPTFCRPSMCFPSTCLQRYQPFFFRDTFKYHLVQISPTQNVVPIHQMATEIGIPTKIREYLPQGARHRPRPGPPRKEAGREDAAGQGGGCSQRPQDSFLAAPRCQSFSRVEGGGILLDRERSQPKATSEGGSSGRGRNCKEVQSVAGYGV